MSDKFCEGVRAGWAKAAADARNDKTPMSLDEAVEWVDNLISQQHGTQWSRSAVYAERAMEIIKRHLEPTDNSKE